MEFFFLPQNQPFAIALILMIGIAVMEGVASLIGGGFSDVIESLFPDIDSAADLSDVSDANPATGVFSRLLGWLRFGKVPVLMLLIVLLTVFGLIGLGLQWVIHSTSAALINGWWLSIPALLLSLPVVRAVADLLYRLLPSDETDAVSDNTFIGRVATITLGQARKDSPAQARLVDEHGYSHYVMLEPHNAAEIFEAGDQVLAVEKKGAVFIAIKNDHAALVDV